MADKKRVLIFALDGFTWRLGSDFMSEGVMPKLAGLVRDGCHGILKSVIPFETAPAWSSFQTGCYPGRTGVFAFHVYDRKTNEIRLSSFADIAVPSLWELADRSGKKVVSLNMPVSSPPPKVNGVIIPGLLCPGLSSETVWPSQAYDEYIGQEKDYLILPAVFADGLKELTEQLISTESVRSRVAMRLVRDIDWDVFCVQIQCGDMLQHRLWNILTSGADGKLAAQRKIALEFYRCCDDIVGRITDSAGDNVLKLIVSDHGFCRLDRTVNLNVWLRQRGYLKLLSTPSESKWNKTKKKFPPLKTLTGLYGLVKNIFSNHTDRPPIHESLLVHLRQVIDMGKTTALCLGGQCGLIYIPGTGAHRSKTAEKIRAELLADMGPDSAGPLIAQIRTGNETYGTKKSSDAEPDLVVEYIAGVSTRLDPKAQTVVSVDECAGGTHSIQGIFAANGPGIKKGTALDGDIVDIVPTILAYLGMAVPRHIDGKVLNGAFEKPFDVRHEEIHFNRNKKAQYSDEEQAHVEKQLTDLGYM